MGFPHSDIDHNVPSQISTSDTRSFTSVRHSDVRATGDCFG
ncbi:hypothetical protein NIES2104_51040 [Leptolyngbya sp. NIES-2104]|nr:hypothetical protein NIES2104_51040 [Leptolyngbya sp. NIES-2104]